MDAASGGSGSNQTKLLQMRARRAQVGAKLAEWEEAHRQADGSEASAEERQRSSQFRQLTKLCSDLDGFIRSLEADDPSIVPGSSGSSSSGTDNAERRAERGRVKARMRQWDREFERVNGRKATDADREGSVEFRELRQRLGKTSQDSGGAAPSAISTRDSSSGSGQGEAPSASEAPPGAVSSWEAALSVAFGGGEYYDTVRSCIRSTHVVDGFAGLRAEEVQAAAAAFIQYDLDRDGVVGAQDFHVVIHSLSQHTGKALDDSAIQRQFALADQDSNGVIDLNEFMALRREMHARRPGGSGKSDPS